MADNEVEKDCVLIQKAPGRYRVRVIDGKGRCVKELWADRPYRAGELADEHGVKVTREGNVKLPVKSKEWD